MSYGVNATLRVSGSRQQVEALSASLPVNPGEVELRKPQHKHAHAIIPEAWWAIHVEGDAEDSTEGVLCALAEKARPIAAELGSLLSAADLLVEIDCCVGASPGELLLQAPVEIVRLAAELGAVIAFDLNH